jgi:hypothetical protein
MRALAIHLGESVFLPLEAEIVGVVPGLDEARDTALPGKDPGAGRTTKPILSRYQFTATCRTT